MTNRTFPIWLILLTALPGPDTLADSLRVAVDTPQVTVPARQPGRKPVALPDLDYHFVLEPACAPGMKPARITLSVADSRTQVTAPGDEHLAPSVETRLTVPAAQLAPVPVSGFCETAAADSNAANDEGAATAEPRPRAATSMLVEAALSVQASLLCTGDDVQKVTWVAKPLDVQLVCALPVPDEEQLTSR